EDAARSPIKELRQFRQGHCASLCRDDLFVARIDYKERGCRMRSILCKERTVLRVIVTQFKPDKLSGVPGEVGVSQQGPHQVAGGSPWSPDLDKEGQVALFCLGESQRIIIVQEWQTRRCYERREAKQE